MSERTLREDSIYYRLEYARIARLLERTSRHDERRLRKQTLDLDVAEPPIPPLRLTLTAAAAKTIDAIVGELTPEQRIKGEVPGSPAESSSRLGPLAMDAARLAAQAGEELRRLRWHWVGRRPPWYQRYLRWLGWRHWRRRREYLLLATFLDRVLEPATVILFFSCQIEQGPTGSPDWILKERHRPPWPLERPTRPQWQGIHEDDLRLWLSTYLLELVSRAQPPLRPEKPERYRTWPRRLPTLLMDGCKRLMGWLGAVHHHPIEEPHYRVRYNLACLLSRASARATDQRAFLSAAEEQLQLALDALRGSRRVALAEWAWRDPGLAALRDAEDYGLERILPPPKRSRT